MITSSIIKRTDLEVGRLGNDGRLDNVVSGKIKYIAT